MDNSLAVKRYFYRPLINSKLLTFIVKNYENSLQENRYKLLKLLEGLLSFCAVVPIFITLFEVRPNFKTRTTALYTF